MGIKRVIDTDFWTDSKIIDEFSPEDKYFWLYLLTNPHTKQVGVYELAVTTASNETGYSKDSIRVLLDRFENTYHLIIRSKSTGEIAILNYLRHSVVKGGKPVMDCLLKEEESIKDKTLLAYIYINLSNNRNTISNTTVLAYIEHIKQYKQYINDNDNDNDNDNERIVPRIVDESYHESSKTKYQLGNEKKANAFKQMVDNCEGFPDILKSKIKEWVDYKTEIKKPYNSERGFQQLLTRFEKELLVHDAEEIINAINDTMAAGYQGIVWDWLDKKNQRTSSAYMDAIKNRVNVVDEWV